MELSVGWTTYGRSLIFSLDVTKFHFARAPSSQHFLLGFTLSYQASFSFFPRKGHINKQYDLGSDFHFFFVTVYLTGESKWSNLMNAVQMSWNMLKPSTRVIQYRFFDCRLPVLLDTLTREEQCSFAKEVIVSVCMKDNVFWVDFMMVSWLCIAGDEGSNSILADSKISTVNTTSPESRLDTCTMEKYHRSQKR